MCLILSRRAASASSHKLVVLVRQTRPLRIPALLLSRLHMLERRSRSVNTTDQVSNRGQEERRMSEVLDATSITTFPIWTAATICWQFPRRFDTSHPLHVSSHRSEIESILHICVDEEAMQRMERTWVRVAAILQTRLDADEDVRCRVVQVHDDQRAVSSVGSVFICREARRSTRRVCTTRYVSSLASRTSNLFCYETLDVTQRSARNSNQDTGDTVNSLQSHARA